MSENKELILDETGQPVDADGVFGDPQVDKIAQSISEYYPKFVFDKSNVHTSFDKLIDSEDEPKIKGLLRLIQGLYLNRKQHSNELNVLFYRIAMLGRSLQRNDRNIEGAFDNMKVLSANDKLLESVILSMAGDLQTHSAKTNKAIKEWTTFKKKHEPKLNRLSKYIKEEGDDLRKKNKELR